MNKQNFIAAIVAAVISALGIGGFSFYQGSELNTYAQGYQSRVFETLEYLDKGDTAPYITTVFCNISKAQGGLPGLETSLYAASFRSKRPFWSKESIEDAVRGQTGAIQVQVVFVINNKILKNDDEFNPAGTDQQ